MAGSIGNMAKVYKKNFTYVPPTPPAELIDCNNFTLDFTGRKFLNVGLDPTDEFNTVVQIITPSRYINMPADFLRRIFSLMGNILSFILDQPQKYKRNLFLETEIISLSSMVYQGENMLVIESKTQAGCRVLLNRADLMKLQYMEESIFETFARKSAIIRPVVLRQFEIIENYIDREFTNVQSPPKTVDEMIIFIKNLQTDQIIKNIDLNFVSQLKMCAARKLAEQWSQRWSGGMSPELIVNHISPLSPMTSSSYSPSMSNHIILAPNKYSSPSPQYTDDTDAQPPPTKPWDITPRQLFSPSFFDGECSQINLTQATYPASSTVDENDGPINVYINQNDAPTSLPSLSSLPVLIDNHSTGHDSDEHPLWYNNRIKSTGPAVDENDGPSSFNHSPSILDFTGGKPMKKSTKRSVKRKL
ncbi:uncharacterized protein LOC132927631 [Rhopalosiphum padi]|uniref:uncharacterized protein LOC132927631 n=1 Tax=Rhopalosiphum padi TaxID=40932 RepID=UPI00298DF0C9|nr:uncharacterized protein LOC132927631 [Rhopalosiphum padi]